ERGSATVDRAVELRPGQAAFLCDEGGPVRARLSGPADQVGDVHGPSLGLPGRRDAGTGSLAHAGADARHGHAPWQGFHPDDGTVQAARTGHPSQASGVQALGWMTMTRAEDAAEATTSARETEVTPDS